MGFKKADLFSPHRDDIGPPLIVEGYGPAFFGTLKHIVIRDEQHVKARPFMPLEILQGRERSAGVR